MFMCLLALLVTLTKGLDRYSDPKCEVREGLCKPGLRPHCKECRCSAVVMGGADTAVVSPACLASVVSVVTEAVLRKLAGAGQSGPGCRSVRV